MKFGVVLPHFTDNVPSSDFIRRMAIEAEELGYDHIWVVDHIVVPYPSKWHSDYGATFYETFSTLGFVIPITKRVQIGTSVTVLTYRHPLLLAKLFSTVDQLSKGRIIAGVGIGSFEEEFQALQTSYKTRGKMANETLEIMKQAWTTNGELNFKGNYWQFENTQFEPRPIQKPHPPIYVAGNTDAGLRRAVEFGEAYHPGIASAEEIKSTLNKMKEACEVKGRDPNTLKLSLISGLKLMASPYDSSHIVGTEDQASKRLDALQELGVDSVVFHTFTYTPEVKKENEDSIMKSISTFAKNIMPKFQD